MNGKYQSWSRKSQAKTTRSSLIEAGRALFGTIGFYETGIPEIVERASVTRGALYHHFDSKEQLFAHVFREVAFELKMKAEAAVASLKGDVWAQFIGGLSNYLQILATTADAQRILMLDGPVVLGWANWRSAQVEIIFSGTMTTLEMLTQQGTILHSDPGRLALLIHASLNEAALAIAFADDHHAESLRMTAALVAMLRGLGVSGDA